MNGTDASGPLCDLCLFGGGQTGPQSCLAWTNVDATCCHPCWGSVGSRSRGHVWSGRAPSDRSLQEGISIPTFLSASVVRATVPKHPSDLWVMPSIIAVAIDGCLFFTTPRQSTQLAQNSASGPNPTPPRDSGSDALETTVDRAPSIYKIFFFFARALKYTPSVPCRFEAFTGTDGHLLCVSNTLFKMCLSFAKNLRRSNAWSS